MCLAIHFFRLYLAEAPVLVEGTRKDERDEKRAGWLRLDGSAAWRLAPPPRRWRDKLAGEEFLRNGRQLVAKGRK